MFPWIRAKLGCLVTWGHVWWIQEHWLKCPKLSGFFGQSEVPRWWGLVFWQMEGLLTNSCNVIYHWGVFGTSFGSCSLSVPHIGTDKPCKWSDRPNCWICKWFFVALCTCVWWKCFFTIPLWSTSGLVSAIRVIAYFVGIDDRVSGIAHSRGVWQFESY